MVLLCSSGLIQLSLRGEFKHASKVLEDGMYGLQQKQVRVLFDLSVRKSTSEQVGFLGLSEFQPSCLAYLQEMHWHRVGFWSAALAQICKAALELYMHGLKFVPCLHFTSLVRCTKPSFYESISNRRSTAILWSPEKLFPQGRTRLHFFCILLSITIVKAHLDSISASASLFSAQWLQRPDLHTFFRKKRKRWGEAIIPILTKPSIHPWEG